MEQVVDEIWIDHYKPLGLESGKEWVRALLQEDSSTEFVSFGDLGVIAFRRPQGAPTVVQVPTIHISDILQAMITRLVESRTRQIRDRNDAINYIGAYDLDAWEDVRSWLIGEPVPPRAYPHFLEVAKLLASVGHPVEIPMVDRLRELAEEAERSS